MNSLVRIRLTIECSCFDSIVNFRNDCLVLYFPEPSPTSHLLSLLSSSRSFFFLFSFIDSILNLLLFYLSFTLLNEPFLADTDFKCISWTPSVTYTVSNLINVFFLLHLHIIDLIFLLFFLFSYYDTTKINSSLFFNPSHLHSLLSFSFLIMLILLADVFFYLVLAPYQSKHYQMHFIFDIIKNIYIIRVCFFNERGTKICTIESNTR